MRQGRIFTSLTIIFFCVHLIHFPFLPLISSLNLNSYSSSIQLPLESLQNSLEFNGTRAYTHLEDQCAFGPRPPGSSNLTACGDYIISSLENQGWITQTQTWEYQSTSLRNIIAGFSLTPQYILLAHYDTRPIADYDPDPLNRTRPILGANDGASGVAALLELAAVLPEEAKNIVTLLFVDAEDSGNYDGWEWIVGSTYFVNTLSPLQKGNIRAAVLLDMMGDADLQIKRERSSTSALVDAIWEIAANLGYDDIFQDVPGFSLIDDHHPFLSAGIPAIDIIDFDYPYWHTQADTPDKCSPASLEIVGRVVADFIQKQLIQPTNFHPNGLTGLLLIFAIVGFMMAVGLLVLIIYRRKSLPNDN
jgi:glutaminyl-peptide cyclotransferase